MKQIHIDPELSPIEARDDEGRVLVVCEPQKGDGSIIEQHAAAVERMAFIVRAVNCHDELVSALEKASEALVFMRVKGSVAIAGFVRDTGARAPVVEMLDHLDVAIVGVRAAVAKARGETP